MTDDARREEPREHDDRVGSHTSDDRERPERERNSRPTTRKSLTERERRERWPLG